jgi:hypothetical protein
VLTDPAFWDQYLPDALLGIGSAGDYQSSHAERLRLFGIRSERRRRAMENFLYGPELWRALDPDTAPPELVIDVERMLDGIWAGPTKEGLRREILQKRMAERTAGPPRRIPLRFGGGWTWTITFERPGIYHHLRKAGRAKPLALGFDDPHFHLPILRRAEAERLTACLARRSPVLARFGGLLLAPTVWLTRDDDPQQFGQYLRSTLRATRVLQDETVETLANAWTVSDVRWRKHRRFGFVNDGEYSHRNPDNHGWSDDDFATFTRFLKACKS